MLLQNLTLRSVQPILQVIESLLTPVDDIHHASKRAVLGEFGQRLPPHQQPVPHGANQALAQSLGLVLHFLAGTNH